MSTQALVQDLTEELHAERKMTAELQRQLDAARAEVKMMAAVQDKLDQHLQDQFNNMQVTLIAFVMHKMNRRTLVIDSTEINSPEFGAMQINVTALDSTRTQYEVRPAKGDNRG